MNITINRTARTHSKHGSIAGTVYTRALCKQLIHTHSLYRRRVAHKPAAYKGPLYAHEPLGVQEDCSNMHFTGCYSRTMYPTPEFRAYVLQQYLQVVLPKTTATAVLKVLLVATAVYLVNKTVHYSGENSREINRAPRGIKLNPSNF